MFTAGLINQLTARYTFFAPASGRPLAGIFSHVFNGKLLIGGRTHAREEPGHNYRVTRSIKINYHLFACVFV